MEPLKLSPARLQPQITVVAILGKLLATMPSLDEMMLLNQSAGRLYWDLVDFTEDLQDTLYRTGDTWWRHNVTSNNDDPPTSLSRALAAYKSTPGTPRNCVTTVASEWQGSVAALVDRWARLTRAATKLCNTCRTVATKAADKEANDTTWARCLQDMAAHYVTAQENMVELGQALGREEGAEVAAEHEARVREDARVDARELTTATMVRQRLEAALGLLERLVTVCDKATAFPQELQRLLRDFEAALKGTNEASPDVPEALVAMVAVAERLWEANARLAQEHLLETLQDINFYFTGDLTSPSDCEVAKRCRRATEDIPRLLQPPECPQSIPNVSPVSVELQELSPALLQPPVAVVATLDDLLATLPRRDTMLLRSAESLHWGLADFTRGLWATLYHLDGTWWQQNVSSDDDDPPISLSQALDAYKSTPGTPRNRVTTVVSKWQGSVATLLDSWVQLAGAATELSNTCREVATEAADRVATATARAMELQHKAARGGTAQENMVELGLALGRQEGAQVVTGHEARVRRDAMVAASEVTRATKETRQVEEALELLERLVAECDEATAFPRELLRRLRDIEAALEGTNEVSPNVPEDLVAKVAEAEQLWEANAHLVKAHLLGTVDDIIEFYFTGGPASPSPCGVAERCLRATEDIPRLVQLPTRPQAVPKVSPVSMEPQELSPALLQPQVTVVAILGKLLATLPRWKKMMLGSSVRLYSDLVAFTRGLWATLNCIDGTWWCHNITFDDDYPVTSLSQALAAYKSTTCTTWFHVTMVVSKWQGLVNALVNSWAGLAREATKICNACREAASEAAYMVAQDMTWARELQDKAARDGTAQKNMVELGQALGREEEAEAAHEARVRREARVAASWASRYTMVRQRVEEALGLLERLVTACDKATAFPRELQRLLRDIEAAMKGTNEASPNVPEDLVAKVAKAERLWEANARLAKDHLVGTLPDIKFYFDGRPASLSACGVAERCQRAIEDIPRLVQQPECPQSVPARSPVSVEPQELFPALLQQQVTVVATLGKLLATLPRLEEEMLPVSALRLYWDLVNFTKELRATLHHTDHTWWRRNVICDDDDPVTFLSRALAAYKSTPWTPWDHVTMAASEWLHSVAVVEESWTELAWAATKLSNACRRVAAEAADMAATATAWERHIQDKAARDGTAQENMVELGQALSREEGDEVVAGHEAWVSRQARVAASKATTATKVRQWAEVSLGLLECLVAACDEATAFPRELLHRVEDIEMTLEETDGESSDVPEDLVAKVAEAERLWEANIRLAKDHLLGTLQDIIKFYFTGAPASPSACGVDERCQRAIEDIPRLLQPTEHPQSIPKVSAVSMELQETHGGQAVPKSHRGHPKAAAETVTSSGQ
ncbi:uncharacterized protein LOC135286327 [Passer domesticus]|uniref:uncharacterized protein LOC135286327 n=1 Tax=Passer domesticus TaxID=48849 RepID=UPI0030FF2861